MLNRKTILISVLACLSIAVLFVGCIPTNSLLLSYTEKYHFFFATFAMGQYQTICYKFALPFTLNPGNFIIKGQLKADGLTSAGQIGSRLEIIRKGKTIFSDDEMGNYDSHGKFHGTFQTNQPATFNKNDIIRFSFAPLSQSFTNADFLFNFTYKAQTGTQQTQITR
jgi:hypothetical protein